MCLFHSVYSIGYKDFVPKCTDPGGFLSSPVFEEFHKVSKRANSWIKGQLDKQILNVQTGRYKIKRSNGMFEQVKTSRIAVIWALMWIDV